MKIIFAGTPDFAAVALKHLIDAGHDIALVLSQPDRRSGRGMKLTPSPVKVLAEENSIPVITPLTLSLKRDPEGSARIHEELKAIDADLLVVAAYGLILPQPCSTAPRVSAKTAILKPSTFTAAFCRDGEVPPPWPVPSKPAIPRPALL